MLCKNCHQENEHTQIFCSHCQQPLYEVDVCLRKLYHKQNQLESFYQKESKEIRQELLWLKNIALKDHRVQHRAISKQPIKTPTPVEKPQPKKYNTGSAYSKKVIEQASRKPPVRPAEPFDWSKVWAGLGPIGEGIELFAKLYSKYKSEGKLPIFFMTITGILALLFGFGYLMQYALPYFGKWEEVVKVGAGFLTSISVIFIGKYLYDKNEKYHDYGSSLVGLGIALNYLMIYFMSNLGEFPSLSSGVLGFILVMLNTVMGLYFSLKFDGKIISVLSLLGGSYAPFYLQSSGDGSIYFLYLWFLTLGAVLLAQKIRWEGLLYLAFINAGFLLELSLFQNRAHPIIFTIYDHLFAYLLAFFMIFDQFRLRKEWKYQHIMILVGGLNLLIFNLSITFNDQPTVLGLLYLLNALIFGVGLFIGWRKADRKVRLGLITIVATFVGISIPVLFDRSLTGFFWTLEAILLISFGLIFKMPQLRKEAWFLLLFGLGNIILQSFKLLENWQYGLAQSSFYNFFFLGIASTIVWFLLFKKLRIIAPYERKIYRVLKEFIPLWSIVIYGVVAFQSLGNWGGVAMIIPIFSMILWRKYFLSKWSIVWGVLSLSTLVFSMIASFQEVGSYHFGDQLGYGKAAMIGLFLTLWTLKMVYNALGLNQKSISYQLLYHLWGLFFMLIPIIFCKIIFKHANEWFEVALSFSMLITYGLSKKVSYSPLKLEVYFFQLAMISTLNHLDAWNAGAIVFVLTLVNYFEASHLKESLQKSPFKYLLIISPFLILWGIDYLITDLFHLKDSGSVSLYITLLLISQLFHQKIAVINRSSSFTLISASTLNLLAIPFSFIETYALGLSLNFINLMLMVYIVTQQYRQNTKRKYIFEILFVMLQFQFVAFYYTSLQMNHFNGFGAMFTVLLTIHAIILLFIYLKTKEKLIIRSASVIFILTILKVVLYDTSGLETPQKIMVFIGLGALLLAASFAYVKLIKKEEV